MLMRTENRQGQFFIVALLCIGTFLLEALVVLANAGRFELGAWFPPVLWVLVAAVWGGVGLWAWRRSREACAPAGFHVARGDILLSVVLLVGVYIISSCLELTVLPRFVREFLAVRHTLPGLVEYGCALVYLAAQVWLLLWIIASVQKLCVTLRPRSQLVPWGALAAGLCWGLVHLLSAGYPGTMLGCVRVLMHGFLLGLFFQFSQRSIPVSFAFMFAMCLL